MANQTLRDLVVAMSGMSADVETVMSHLTKKSGILKTALVKPASHNIYHSYKKIAALPSFTVGGITQDLTDETVSKDEQMVHLTSIDAIQTEYKKYCDNYPGGARAFFNDQYLPFIEAWGQAASKQIVYGTDSTFGNVRGFLGFHQYAKAYGNRSQRGGTSGSTTSIFAVKWDSNSCALLYDKALLQATAAFLKVSAINGGEFYTEVINDGGSDQAKKIVYGTLYESTLGLFSASEFDIAAMTQIQDDTGDKPTAATMSTILDYVKSFSGGTFLYGNLLGARLLSELKDSKFEMGVVDKNYDIRVDYYNSVPFIIDENISSVETDVLD